jgi:hypothetical protein
MENKQKYRTVKLRIFVAKIGNSIVGADLDSTFRRTSNTRKNDGIFLGDFP